MTALQRALLACACAALVLLPAATEAGKRKKKKQETFYYEVTGVKADAEIPGEVPGWVRDRLGADLGDRPVVITELPEAAPDPKEKPKAFKKFLARRSIRAFKVNVEITDYSQEVEKLRAPRRGHHVTVRISLRIFGETIPDRVMAFTGDGSSTIKIEVGKRVRDRDVEVANADAIEMAVAEAVAESLVKLGQPPPGKPVRGKK